MPRVTDQQQYGRYSDLYYSFQRFKLVFAVLTQNELRDLYVYYLPMKQLSQAEHRIHRNIMDEKEPELAAKAGKFYAQVTHVFAIAIKGAKGDINRFNSAVMPFVPKENLKPPRHNKNLQAVTVSAVEERDPIDWDRYAYTLLQHAKIKMEQERDSKLRATVINPSPPSLPPQSTHGTAEAAQLALNL